MVFLLLCCSLSSLLVNVCNNYLLWLLIIINAYELMLDNSITKQPTNLSWLKFIINDYTFYNAQKHSPMILIAHGLHSHACSFFSAADQMGLGMKPSTPGKYMYTTWAGRWGPIYRVHACYSWIHGTWSSCAKSIHKYCMHVNSENSGSAGDWPWQIASNTGNTIHDIVSMHSIRTMPYACMQNDIFCCTNTANYKEGGRYLIISIYRQKHAH